MSSFATQATPDAGGPSGARVEVHINNQPSSVAVVLRHDDLQSAAQLKQSLRDTPALVSLQLVSCGLESRHLMPLCAELHASPVRRKELDLSGNKIADAGLVALSEILETAQVVTIPGAGFGPGGEGFLRLSAFASRENCEEASARLKKMFA